MWSVDSIGATAGLVWNFLQANGKSSLSAVQSGVREHKSLIDMSIGWLAREGKIELAQEKRSVQVWLKEG